MQTFSNVTDPVWQCLRAKAASYGVEIDSNSGTASKLGAKASWNYDPAASTLQIQITKTPPFFGCSTLNAEMHKIVEACMTASAAAMTPLLDH
jgi:hypothetical protein